MVIELMHEEQVRLSEMAAATQLSEAQLAREAMHWFLAAPASQREIVARGRDDIAAGRTIDHDVLFEQIDRALSE